MPNTSESDQFVQRDGRSWPLGTAEDVEWIRRATITATSIDAAIPLVYDAYATITEPEENRARIDVQLLDVLDQQTVDRRWWLGYLDTGMGETVFPDAPRVRLYADWQYVLVQAGPQQARLWRTDGHWRGALPDLIFPTDRSWLMSQLWDDSWRCLGGATELVAALTDRPELQVRIVEPGHDATPPGSTAY